MVKRLKSAVGILLVLLCYSEAEEGEGELVGRAGN